MDAEPESQNSMELADIGVTICEVSRLDAKIMSVVSGERRNLKKSFFE